MVNLTISSLWVIELIILWIAFSWDMVGCYTWVHRINCFIESLVGTMRVLLIGGGF